MTAKDDQNYRTLKRTHQQLLRNWKRNKGFCIVCAQSEGKGRDHLPPKVLLPSEIRNQDTQFFTFPVCDQCNNLSSDEDFLFSILLSVCLNQESILRNQKPTDPDLIALDRQTQKHLNDPKKGRHRTALLRRFMGTDPDMARDAINLDRLPVNQTLTKIVKSIYWLHTGGDILQRHRPGWWIRTDIDSSKEQFLEKHLKTTHADLHWDDRFIVRFTLGHPESGVGGMISSSLHFYTKGIKGMGMSWLVIGSPSLTRVNGISLYEMSKDIWGPPTIEP